MEFQIKLFNWQDQGNHLIVLARGPMDGAAFGQLFREIQIATEHLSKCKVLVDLSASAYEMDGTQIEGLVRLLPLEHWPPGNKVALVSALETSGFHQLYFLRMALDSLGIAIEVFRDTKIAIDWLAEFV